MAGPEAPTPESLLLEPRKERIEEVLSLRTRSLTVVLDRLEDPFNMAAVLRTSEAMGIQEVHVIEHPEARFHPSVKVTQGCDKWLDLAVYQSFALCREVLKARGFALWAAALCEGGKSLFSLRFDSKVALVFGNERFGVSREVLDGIDGTFWIPMRGFTRSLNVSAAVSACLTRAVGWRLENQGPQGDLSETEVAGLRERFQALSVKQRHKLYK